MRKQSFDGLYRLGLLYLFINFPNIKHISHENEPWEKCPPFAVYVHSPPFAIEVLFSHAPVLRQGHDNGPSQNKYHSFIKCKDNIQLRIV